MNRSVPRISSHPSFAFHSFHYSSQFVKYLSKRHKLGRGTREKSDHRIIHHCYITDYFWLLNSNHWIPIFFINQKLFYTYPGQFNKITWMQYDRWLFLPHIYGGAMRYDNKLRTSTGDELYHLSTTLSRSICRLRHHDLMAVIFSFCNNYT